MGQTPEKRCGYPRRHSRPAAPQWVIMNRDHARNRQRDDRPPRGHLLPGTRLLGYTWLRWGLVCIGLAGVSVDAALAIADSGPDGLAWGLAGAAPIAVAIVVIMRRPGHPLAGWVALAAFGSVAQLLRTIASRLSDEQADATALVLMVLVYGVLGLVGAIGVAAILSVFADGIVRSRVESVGVSALWISLLVPPLVIIMTPNVPLPFYFGVDSPPPNPLFAGVVSIDTAVASGALGSIELLVIAVALVIAARRYVRADEGHRQPMRWLLLPVIAFGVALATQLVLAPSEQYWIIAVAWSVAGLTLPAAVVLGLLRPGPLDADRVLRRSLVYGVLWVVIAALYAIVSAAVGYVAGEQIPIGWALALTVVAAVAFQPLRARLERVAERWVFGRQSDPSRAIARLGAALSNTYDVGDLLPRMERTLEDGLGVEWARVRLDGTEGGAPAAGDPALVAPIELHGERIGAIECGPKKRGPFTPADEAAVHTLAGQAALAVGNVRLTAELAAQTVQLKDSRQRLVRAQDAERRRIERNIHDGVQQDLVALIGMAGQARKASLLRPGTVDTDLAAMHAALIRVLADLRSLAQGIHPAVLTDWGLVAAVEALASRHPVPVAVHTEPSLRGERYAADVEEAGYFTVAEALANSLKHASATRVDVSLARENGSLTVSVADDGVGFDATQPGGNGLSSLSSRVAAADGTLVVRAAPGEGTVIAATLVARSRSDDDVDG